jgi:hypothetical protein
MPKRHTGETVFVVQRLNWVRSWPLAEGFLVRLPGRTRLQSFPDGESAEALCRDLEEKARDQINPFRCGNVGLSDKSSLDGDRLHDWLLDAGIEAPSPTEKSGVRDWAGWWQQASLTSDQRRFVWKALDRVRFHEVVERPKRPVVYVVAHIGWHYTDQDFVAEPAGGKPIKVFRDRFAAERECDDCNEIARDVWEDNLESSNETLDMRMRLERQSDPFGAPPAIDEKTWGEIGPDRVQDAPFYEVVEVELEP